MPYLNADGTIVDRRSPWRFSIIADCFWAVADFIWFFISTMIFPESAHHSLRSNDRSRRRGGGGGGGGGGGPSGGGKPKPRIRGMRDMPSSRMTASAAGG